MELNRLYAVWVVPVPTAFAAGRQAIIKSIPRPEGFRQPLLRNTAYFIRPRADPSQWRGGGRHDPFAFSRGGGYLVGLSSGYNKRYRASPFASRTGTGPFPVGGGGAGAPADILRRRGNPRPRSTAGLPPPRRRITPPPASGQPPLFLCKPPQAGRFHGFILSRRPGFRKRPSRPAARRENAALKKRQGMVYLSSYHISRCKWKKHRKNTQAL